MTTIQRLTDSCILLTTDSDATLFDPGFHTFQAEQIGLEAIGDVTRVCVTHEHADHVNPDFIKWLIDRRADLTVHANQSVVDLLQPHGIEATTSAPRGVEVEDVAHERIPTGDAPPNRAFTVDGLLTHPGDSHQPSFAGKILALPLLAPWTSTTAAVDFARRLGPDQVIPCHDFYLAQGGRTWLAGMVKRVLAADGIEVIPLDWGESYTI